MATTTGKFSKGTDRAVTGSLKLACHFRLKGGTQTETPKNNPSEPGGRPPGSSDASRPR